MYHWSMEQAIYTHLDSVHRREEMVEVPECEWDNEEAIMMSLEPDSIIKRRIPRMMNALAYYTAAVARKEQTHIPLIGPSVDRRMLSLLHRVCNSETICSLICASCAQVHVSVTAWTQQFHHTQTWKAHGDKLCAIQYYRVQDSLLKLMQRNPDTFQHRGKSFQHL